jgi:hypothetical protein
MFKDVNALMARASAHRNTRDAGKVKVKEIVDHGSDVSDYTSEKIEIRMIEGKGRGVVATHKIYRGELIMVGKAMFLQKHVGTSSTDKLVEMINQEQRKNPLTTTLQLNYLCGGPIDHELPPLGFKVFTGELTDYLLTN